jgi:hypothetical protein
MDRTAAMRQPRRRRTPRIAILLRRIAKSPSQAQNNHDEAPNDG